MRPEKGGAGDLQHLDVLHARVAERLRHRLRGAAHLLRGKAGGGHAGDAAEVHQRLLPVVEPRLQVASASRTMPFAAMLTLPSWRGASRRFP